MEFGTNLKKLIFLSKWIGALIFLLEVILIYINVHGHTLEILDALFYFSAIGTSLLAVFSAVRFSFGLASFKAFLRAYLFGFLAFAFLTLLFAWLAKNFAAESNRWLYLDYTKQYIAIIFLSFAWGIYTSINSNQLKSNILIMKLHFERNENTSTLPLPKVKKSQNLFLILLLSIWGVASLKLGRAEGSLFITYFCSASLGPALSVISAAGLVRLFRNKYD
jgi:hypothetical protein